MAEHTSTHLTRATGIASIWTGSRRFVGGGVCSHCCAACPCCTDVGNHFGRGCHTLPGLLPTSTYTSIASDRFLPEAKNTMIAYLKVGPDGVHAAGFIPCWVNPKAQPVALGKCAEGEEVAASVESLKNTSRLKADFRWHGDRVLFLGDCS